VTVEEALAELRAILGETLCPALVPKIESILARLEEDSYKAGCQQARETVGHWC